MKRMVDELQVVFTNANTYGKDAQRFKTGIAKDMTVEQAPTEKEVIHPLVRTHPETGRKALYLSTTHFSRIDGMTKPESRIILDQLAKHAISLITLAASNGGTTPSQCGTIAVPCIMR